MTDSTGSQLSPHGTEVIAGGSSRDQYDNEHCQAELFKTIVESSATAHFVANGDRFLYVTPGFASLSGYGRTEFLSMEPHLFFSHEWLLPTWTVGDKSPLLPPSVKGGWEGFFNELKHSPGGEDSSKGHEASSLRFETKITTKDGTEKWVAMTLAPITQMEGPACIGTVVDISHYRQREEILLRSERKYKSVFEFAPDMIAIYNAQGEVADFNPAGIEVAGWSLEETTQLGILGTWSEEDRARFDEIREQTLKYGEWFGEVRASSKDGRMLTLESRVKVADTGPETFIICISRDVTDRKRMEEQIRSTLKEKEMLLREIHHRVKNNMQIISTLLKLQLRNADDDKTRALFRESQNRILSMAMIHEKLYQSEGLHRINLNDYMTDLAEEVFASFGEDFDRIALRKDVEDISLGMDIAIPCGLIVIELLSNALKYAFPDGRRGEIYIGLRSIVDYRFELMVSDNGVGLPMHLDITRIKSLGLRLVSDLAKYQLEGEMDLLREGGTTVCVRFQERTKPGENEHA